MTSALRQLVAAASNLRELYLGDAVTYARGASTVSILATPGETRLEYLDPVGVTVAATLRDWIVTAADLVIAATTVKPARGDRIAVSETEVYEVHSPAPGMQCYHEDPTGTQIRIHTKRVT